MNRPDIEQLEDNLRKFPYGDIGGKVALELISYIKYLEEEMKKLRYFDAWNTSS